MTSLHREHTGERRRDRPAHARCRRAARAAALLLGGLLAGCSWIAGGEDDVAAPPDCPPVLILDGAARTTAYAPGQDGRSGGIRYLAALGSLQSQCAYTADGLQVDLRVPVLVEPGPAFDGGPISLALFVATVGRDDTVLGKRRLESRVGLANGATRGGQVEEVTLRLPVFSPSEARGRRLFVGFQLAPGEIRTRGRRFSG